MQIIVYHSKARKTMCGMGTFCLIGMISFQLTMQNSEMIKADRSSATVWIGPSSSEMYLIATKTSKTLKVVFSSGEEITFTGS
ncbi:hypothetical protein [[Clostridium] symbiosum]|uniref:hypothetical protein n=1 Tax=Clostridium symbiosum TaxID=1512 RepID=UPI00214B5B5B|nr:hypothetical protein [[Clostridium] symbiosum]MCR1941217.1 hypothetical protein [[Clostridium] symbiosum]